jgi:transposase
VTGKQERTDRPSEKDTSDRVDANGLERFISKTIDDRHTEERLEGFYPDHRDDGRGRPCFHPVRMLKVLVFGYAIGVRSSRKRDRSHERAIAMCSLAVNTVEQKDVNSGSLFGVKSSG